MNETRKIGDEIENCADALSDIARGSLDGAAIWDAMKLCYSLHDRLVIECQRSFCPDDTDADLRKWAAMHGNPRIKPGLRGDIDEVAIFTEGLSPDETRQLLDNTLHVGRRRNLARIVLWYVHALWPPPKTNGMQPSPG